MKFRLVLFVCVTFICVGVCEEVVEDAPLSVEVKTEDDGRDGKTTLLTGSNRRLAVQSSGNATRDSQLLSLLAARRRQLLNERLATHVNTIASLANKTNRSGGTFAQLELRDSNSSIIKKITLSDSTSNDATPTLKLITTDGSKEIRQELKAHEIKHLFIPKNYQETRSRAGFLNNRRKDTLLNKTAGNINLSQESVNDNTSLVALYIPPDGEKLEGPEKEIILDPEEEFQVDESNHGLYLLNFSDSNNATNTVNKTIGEVQTKDNDSIPKTADIPLKTSFKSTENNKTIEISGGSENRTVESEVAITANITDSKNAKVENEKDKINNTLFMSDELYNHFRPLESDLTVEQMAPFIFFGQKLGGQSISDNLTNSPSLSASTKSVNFIVAPPDKRKFNSRYSATEKYKNISANEDEINEDMDVSVVKNVIEKNKVRNSVKGPAPGRHVGLVNAYRKQTLLSTTKSPIISQISNVTEATQIPVNITVSDKIKDLSLKTNSTAPRNYTRVYYNTRRRPARVTSSSTEITLPLNSTTEKASTLVYTAVVTSVSITSSMKGQNKTDGISKENDNATLSVNIEPKKPESELSTVLSNETETTTQTPTQKSYKHRIRIRTTTTESSNVVNSTPFVYVHKLTDAPPTTESTKITTDKAEIISSKLPERLVALYRQTDISNSNETTSTLRPQNILKRRRRPTTTTAPTTLVVSVFTSEKLTTMSSTVSTLPPTLSPQSIEPSTIALIETPKTVVVTSRTSSESRSKKPLGLLPSNPPIASTEHNNAGIPDDGDQTTELSGLNEEVVIEAEKSYTASYILAGLGFLPVAAIIIFVLRSITNKKVKEIDTDYDGYFDDSDIKKETPIIPVARPPLPPPTKPDQKWEFPRNKLRLQTLLGQGNFGQVWKAEADDLTGHDGLTRLVAVKSIKETASQKEKQELLHEIYIMQKIGTHPNVVTLLACCTEQEPYLLIMEYVMCGKLLTYLRERRSRPDRFSGSGALTSRDLTVFAYCVARGMDYIASKGIVHRDLAARNVLVDHNKLCKIADYGMSREIEGEERSRPPQRHALPVRWMAPEALLYNVYNHQTDVWAYGILLWEIVTLGSTPYAAMTGREVLTAVTEGYRLERPPHCKPQLYRAMHSCWHADPSQRPSFATLKAQLADLLDNEPVEGNYVDLDSFYQESSVYSDPSAIIHDDEGLSSEYDRERRCFRELAPGPKYDNRAFNFRDEELRSKFGIGTPRMGGFGIRDVPFNDRKFNENSFKDRNFADKDFGERAFSDKSFPERNFSEKSFTERNFPEKSFPERNYNTEPKFSDRAFNPDPNFSERKDGKLSTSSFHRERDRENPLVSRNSFNGFPRVGSRENHFQIMTEGRNKRVPEFECDI